MIIGLKKVTKTFLVVVLFSFSCSMFSTDPAEKPIAPTVDIFKFQDILKNSSSGSIVDFIKYEDLFINNDTLYRNNSNKFHESYNLISRLYDIIGDSLSRSEFSVNWTRTGILDGSFEGKDTVKLSERSYEIFIDDSLMYQGTSYFTLKRSYGNEWKVLSWIDNSDLDTSYFNPYFN